jgi:Protein of unknown function (DUF3987)/Primase C terminal 2 (PriCT-2)
MQPHPKTHCGDLAAPPPALTPLCLMPHWLVWKWQRSPNGRSWTKPPFCSDDPSRYAANNNPATWSTRPAAVKAVLAGKASGIGFALTDTEIGAIDLDDCRDPETGKVDDWAQEVLNAAASAYREVTVSGSGLRIIGIAKGAAQHKKFAISGGRPDAAIEVYRRAVRYITISGLEISNCAELPNIDAVIDNIVARHDRAGDSTANGFHFDKGDQNEKKEEPKPEWSEREEARVRAALEFIPAVDRQVWLHVGMSLHWTGWDDRARQIWDDWSKTAPEKFDEKDQGKTWRGFLAQRDKAKTLATLFALAIEGGWDSAVEGTQEGNSSAASPHSWDDPDVSILDDRRGELPEFPLDVFSPSWQTWATNAAHGAGVTADHVMIPLLGISSALIGTARRVKASSSWSEPFTTWAAVVGFSGSGKTPGLDVSQRALSKIEHARKARITELQRKHETNVERARAAFKLWKEQVAEAVEAAMPAPPMPSDADVPDEFVAPRLFVTDHTVEKLAVLLQARPRGILLIRDELAGLFLNLSRYSNGSDREFWCEAWNGKPHRVERIGRPSVAIDHLLVGLVGGFQPDKLARAFKGDADGLYARLCFGWPLEPDYQPLTDNIEEVEPEFENTLVRLIDLPAEEEGELIITPVLLSAAARQAFEQFRQSVHKEKSALEGREREWWSKAPPHVLRLAGTVAYLDWARRTAGQPVLVQEPNKIEKKFVDAAIRLVRDYFWPHSRAALRQIGLSERHANARRVLRWISAHNRPDELSREEIRRYALGKTLDANATQKLLDDLVKAGWLRQVTNMTAGRPNRRWLANPKLFLEGRSERSERSES